MLKRFIPFLLAAFLAVPAAAQVPTNPLSPMQAGLAITSATSLTVPTGTGYAVVCARGGNANYTTDGTTTPTGSAGMQLLQNQCILLTGSNAITFFKAIQQTGSTTTLDVSYFR